MAVAYDGGGLRSVEPFRDIQRQRMGKRWHGDYGYDFDQQAQDVP